MRADKPRRLRCSWLAPLLMVGLAACACPKPDTIEPRDLTPEEKTQVSVAREYLAAAETRGTWSPDDEEKYSAAIAYLPQEAKFQLKKDLFVRMNSRKIKLIRKVQKPGRRVCPSFCEATTVTRQNPNPPAKVDAK